MVYLLVFYYYDNFLITDTSIVIIVIIKNIQIISDTTLFAIICYDLNFSILIFVTKILLMTINYIVLPLSYYLSLEKYFPISQNQEKILSNDLTLCNQMFLHSTLQHCYS